MPSDLSSYDFGTDFGSSEFILPTTGSSSSSSSYTSNVVDSWDSEYGSTDSWFVDSGDSSIYSSSTGNSDSSGSKDDDSFWDTVFKWANSNIGLSTLGGAISGFMSAYNSDEKSYESDTGGDSGPSAAELHDAALKVHNASINEPMDMGIKRVRR